MGDKEERFSNATMAALFYFSTKREPQYMRKLTGKLKELKDAGVEHGIVFDRTAGGHLSYSMENYYGTFLVAGDAISRNPVKLNESGLEICKEAIRDSLQEKPDETKKLLKYLYLEKEICS